MDTPYWRFLNGDMQNGVQFASDDLSAVSQSYAQSIAGTYFLPTLGLSREDDVRLQITTASARTVTFTPILVSGFNAQEGGQPRQTQRVPTNTSRAILDTTGQADA